MAKRYENPDFVPLADLRAEWARMRTTPVGLVRPLVLFGGWRAMRWPVARFGRFLAGLTGARPGQVRAIGFGLCGSFARACERAVGQVEAVWPSEDPERTVEVDVVAVSMGGLVARAAAMRSTGFGSVARRRLRIARLFTMATPHRGATLAKRIARDGCARDMRPGSEFLARLNGAAREYELICYARLNDWWVGASNAAPPEEPPIWIDAPPLFSHQVISPARSIRPDIARRLRGEEPLGRPSKPPRD